MLFIYKNKGILVPVYLMASLIAVAIIFSLLKDYVEGLITTESDFTVVAGIGFVIAGIWTYLTRDSYYISNRERRPMNEDNSFFFISMRLWAYIFVVTGLMCITGGTLEVLGYID